jgi:hypothetical protein
VPSSSSPASSRRPTRSTAAVERCLSTFRADRTWVLVHTEYRLHAARHPEAAAALGEHSADLHARLTDLIEDAAGRTGVRLAVPAGELARIVLALHDGMVAPAVGLRPRGRRVRRRPRTHRPAAPAARGHVPTPTAPTD